MDPRQMNSSGSIMCVYYPCSSRMESLNLKTQLQFDVDFAQHGDATSTQNYEFRSILDVCK